MTTLIVDGHNNFVRCYAVYPSTNSDGQHFGAVVGFLRSLCSFITATQATQVIVVFDGEGGSKRRRALNSEYKNGRKPLHLNRAIDLSHDQEKRSRIMQSLRLREYLSDLPLSVVEIKDIEADDTIAFLCQWLPGEKVIASNDKDYLQLLNDNVKIYKPTKKQFYTVQDCIAEHNIAPVNMALARAIAGDPSDNIKGVKGIGLKRLVTLLPEFRGNKKIDMQSLFAICEQKEQKLFVENKDLIEDNYKLMRLTDPIISAFSINQIKSSIKEHPTLRATSLRLKLIRDGIDLGFNFDKTFQQLSNAIKLNQTNEK